MGKLVLSLAGISRHGYARLKQQNAVLLDGKPAWADERVRAGQTLTVLLADAENAVSEQLPIVYADEDLLVIDKPAPMPTMSSPGKPGPSVQSLLTRKGGMFRPVNRLDKGTSGLMICASNAYVQQKMQKTLHTDAFVREYLAVTEGVWTGEGWIDLPIEKASADSVRRVVAATGKPCRTHYQTLESGCGRTLVRLRLETGRTHQIRVHLSAIGHPVCGDYLYGQALPELRNRFALHSFFLSFSHPVSGQTLSFTSPLPEVCARLLKPV